MTISFKDAVNKMKKDPKAKYFFFFCEKDKNGKPVMLADTKRIDPKANDEVKKTLETAKSKGSSGGVMHIDEGGALNLKPQGSGLAASKLETGVKIAAGNAQVTNLIRGIKVGKPETKDEDDQTEEVREVKKEPTPETKAPESTAEQKLEKEIATLQEMLAKEEARDKQEKISALLEKKEAELAKLTGGVVPTASSAPKQNRPMPTEKLDPSKVRAKEKGSEYIDEDKKAGWRANTPQGKENTSFVTEYATDKEQSRVKIVDGKLQNAEGEQLEGTHGFVVDPETLDLHTFKGKIEIENTKTGDRRLASDSDMKKKLGPDERFVATHHTTPLAGKAVAGAGEIETDDEGRITKIQDKSGHYKPEADLTHQTVQALKDKGAMLREDKIVAMDDDGDEEEADYADEKAYETLQAFRKKLNMDERDSLAEKLKLLQKQEPKTPPVEKAIKELQMMIQVESGLRERGVGPSNKQATVVLGGKGLTEEEFNKVKGDRVKINELLRKKYGVQEALREGVDPAILSNMLKLNNEIRENMESVQMGAETFVGTGGGEKAIRQKESVTSGIEKLINEKLWEKIKGDRDKINQEIRKRIGRANLLPPTTSEKILQSRASINALIAKGVSAPPPPLSTRKIQDPDEPSKQITIGELAARQGKTIDQVVKEQNVDTKEEELDYGMDAGWENEMIRPTEAMAKRMGMSMEELKDMAERMDPMTGELLLREPKFKHMSLEEIYEMVTGNKA